MKISYEFPGATPEQLARAVAAAWKFFDPTELVHGLVRAPDLNATAGTKAVAEQMRS